MSLFSSVHTLHSVQQQNQQRVLKVQEVLVVTSTVEDEGGHNVVEMLTFSSCTNNWASSVVS